MFMSQEISKYELGRVLRDYLADAKSDHEIEYAYKSFVFYVSKKSHLFDDSATHFVSEISDGFMEYVEKSVEDMADGKERREKKRQIAIVKGEHFLFEKIIKYLYQEPSINIEINKPTEIFFTKLGQIILDYLYEIPKKSIKRDEYVILTLLYSAIDELLVSFHLAQHGFASQSFHHSRTVLEITDMVELFKKEKKWVLFWDDSTKSQHDKWKKLCPSKVRSKLGKKGHDASYGLLSEMGTHITSYYMKSKIKEKVIDLISKKNFSTIKIGGSAQEWSIVSANSACIHSTVLLLHQIVKTFQQYLPEDDVMEKLLEITEEYKNYFLEGFVKYSKENGKDAKEVEDFLKKMKIDY